MIRPIGNRVLVKDVQPKKNAGLIELPDQVLELSGIAEVIAIGNGPGPWLIKPGDSVVIPVSKNLGTIVNIETERLKIFNLDDIIAIV